MKQCQKHLQELHEEIGLSKGEQQKARNQLQELSIAQEEQEVAVAGLKVQRQQLQEEVKREQEKVDVATKVRVHSVHDREDVQPTPAGLLRRFFAAGRCCSHCKVTQGGACRCPGPRRCVVGSC